MKTKLYIVKIGGKVIENQDNLSVFLTNFSKLKGPKILVHGGGNSATELSKKLGLTPKLIDGRRVTTNSDLEVVTMVYAGLLNKKIVATLQSKNCNAIGLSGADANVISSDKRAEKPINFGLVGDINNVDTNFIKSLVNDGITPVFCAITHTKKGQLLNTNADSIASEIAIALSGIYDTELLYCFEKEGVLLDLTQENSVISNITNIDYLKLKAMGIIHKGMMPKVENGFHALKNKVGKVLIGSEKLLENKHVIHTELSLLK